jgi:hypothetical protein
MLNAIKQKFQALTGSSSTVTINGQTVTGKSIVVRNGRLEVDGEGFDLKGLLQVTIVGDVASLQVDAGTVEIQGHCQDINTGSGDVMCGAVAGGVKTGSGNVMCHDVFSTVTTGSGNVTAEEIHGAVNTRSGNIIQG